MYTLKLDDNAVNGILQALGNLPFNQVAGLIGNISKQIQDQDSQKENLDEDGDEG